MNKIDHCETAAFRLATDTPESDGTLEWDSNTLALVRGHCHDKAVMKIELWLVKLAPIWIAAFVIAVAVALAAVLWIHYHHR